MTDSNGNNNKNEAVQTAIAAVEAAQQVRYAGRPEVGDSDQVFGCEGHCNEIMPGLYLGDMHAAGAEMLSQLQSLSIGAIVNCTMDHEVQCTMEDRGIEYARIAVHDEDMAQILPYLTAAAQFIDRHISAGTGVLVHCQRGVSRSATVVIGYLMKYHQMTRDQAYVRAKTRRSVVSPNIGFWNQLQLFESQPAALQDCTFDEAWCRKSLAGFSMGGDSAFADVHGAGRETGKIALLGALDFVLGRGINASDLSWFKGLTQLCAGGVEEVERIMQDPEFIECWELDLGPGQLEAIVTKIR